MDLPKRGVYSTSALHCCPMVLMSTCFPPRLQGLTGLSASLDLTHLCRQPWSFVSPVIYLLLLVPNFPSKRQYKTTKWRSTLKSIQSNPHKIAIDQSTVSAILRSEYVSPRISPGLYQSLSTMWLSTLHISGIFHCLVLILRWHLFSDEALPWI